MLLTIHNNKFTNDWNDIGVIKPTQITINWLLHFNFFEIDKNFTISIIEKFAMAQNIILHFYIQNEFLSLGHHIQS